MSASNLVYVCEICQTILHEHHCKAVCPNCGRMFDCSDLAAMSANASYDENGFTLRPGSDPRDWLPNAAPSEEPRQLSESAETYENLP